MREQWEEVEVFSGDPRSLSCQSLGTFHSYNPPLGGIAVWYCSECGEIYGARRRTKPSLPAHWFFFDSSCRNHAIINRFSKHGGGFLIEPEDDISILPIPLMLHDLEVASHIWKSDYERNCANELRAFAAYAKLKASDIAAADVCV